MSYTWSSKVIRLLRRLHKSHLGNNFFLGNFLRNVFCHGNKFPSVRRIIDCQIVGLAENVAENVSEMKIAA